MFYQKAMSQNANFEHGGFNIQRVIMQALFNVLSMSLLFRVDCTSGYYWMQKE